jgi:2,5-furandicarboxylate decarboxylase 1
MNLREFIHDLESADQLYRIKKPVDPRYISALSAQSDKGIFIEKVIGYDLPLTANLVGTMDRLAIGMCMEKRDMGRAVAKAVHKPIEPVMVKNAPCQELVIQGNDVDLTRLPLPLQGKIDGAPYISAGLTIATDPKYGRNAGFYRLMYNDPKHLGIGLTGPSDLRMFYQNALAENRSVPLAIAIGTHPIDQVAVTYKAPIGYDELAIAGALRGEPIKLIACKTIDAVALADAEIVLECEILPTGFTTDEGRFGEFTRFVGNHLQMPLMEVKAITMRKDAIFQAIHMPWENIILDAPVYEASAWNVLEIAGIQTTAVHVNTGGCGQFHVVAAIKKRAGEGKNALLALLSVASFKYAIVVDDDIDVYDPDQVEWAIFSRVQADRDVIIISGARAKPLDPSLPPVNPPALPLTAKLGIDATIPEYANKTRYETITYPFMDKVKLEDYLD